MPSLRILSEAPSIETHGDEVLACAFTPDGRQIVSGGWDGCLRVWDARTGQHLQEIKVGKKPVSACAVSVDGKQLLSGTLEGMLTYWDVGSQEAGTTYLAHSRPMSGIVYSRDGLFLVTCSWDKNVIIWNQRHQGRTLSGHEDIVAGCQLSLDNRLLVSWSYDHTVRLWDVATGHERAVLTGLADRVLAGAISPDQRWIAAGSRDRVLKLWDAETRGERASQLLEAEARFCGFVLDGRSLVAADASGRVVLFTVPDMNEQCVVQLPVAIASGAMSASTLQFVFGCGDGRVHRADIDGMESTPFLVVVTKRTEFSATSWQKMFGKKTEHVKFFGVCPACSGEFAFPGRDPNVEAPCPNCQRPLRVTSVIDGD